MRLVYVGVAAALLWLSVYRLLVTVGRRRRAVNAIAPPAAPTA
jgi:hypothetical protein